MARSGLEVQQAVIKALFMREIKTRFGKYRLGYLWAVLEPGAHLMVLVGVFGYVMHKTMPDISYPVFLINGIVPYLLFSNIATRSINAIEANRGLFNYRPVKPIDTILARALLESLISSCVYIIMMSVVGILGESFTLVNVILLFLSWLLLVILSCGVGFIFMVVGKTFPETEKFIPIIIKPLYFISCIMFPLHAIPHDYWPYLLWNPIIHIVEINRECMVVGYVSRDVSLLYVAFCSIFILFIGLITYRICEEDMLTS